MYKEIKIDALSPAGNTALLLDQFEQVIKDYLNLEDQKMVAGDSIGAHSIIKENGGTPLGATYTLRLSLEESIE